MLISCKYLSIIEIILQFMSHHVNDHVLLFNINSQHKLTHFKKLKIPFMSLKKVPLFTILQKKNFFKF